MKLNNEKITDLTLGGSQEHPECKIYTDLWNRYECNKYDWVKNTELMKHKMCSSIFKKYLDCVIQNYSK